MSMRAVVAADLRGGGVMAKFPRVDSDGLRVANEQAAMRVSSVFKLTKSAVVLEHQTLVISRWLNRCYAGQWTPFEAAKAIEKELDKAGYKIVPKATQ